ncbi:MAG: PAS domain S-box protein [Opitutales bacterium]|nr:PAS domain S-box protein [Verrucomicrobiota bacterium]MBQ2731593.1 PAS domain S-box protein [Opitutales bacterium]
MAAKKSSGAGRRVSSIERILGRLDDLDSANLTILVQRLARERGLFEMLFDTIDEGILVIDSTGTIEYANRAGMRMVGLRGNETGNAILWKLVPDLARTLDFFGEDNLAPNIARDAEIFYPEHRWLRLQLSRISLQSTEPARFVVILRDITADRESTEEMIESERVNSIFTLAASVAHEIGNPLNSMKIHLELIRRKLAKLDVPAESTKSLKNSVAICLEEISRLDDILKNFLGAIRPQKPDLVKTNLVEIVIDVLGVQKVELENRNIRCSMIQASKELPVVLGDESQLKQLVFNVTKNAMEAMQDGGSIAIELNCDEEFVYLRVKDSGCGINRDDISKIYEPFFTTKNNGHGLGMMIVMRIMREHGGQVGIDSTPGTGTTVTLQFPKPGARARMLPPTK